MRPFWPGRLARPCEDELEHRPDRRLDRLALGDQGARGDSGHHACGQSIFAAWTVENMARMDGSTGSPWPKRSLRGGAWEERGGEKRGEGGEMEDGRGTRREGRWMTGEEREGGEKRADGLRTECAMVSAERTGGGASSLCTGRRVDQPARAAVKHRMVQQHGHPLPLRGRELDLGEVRAQHLTRDPP